MYGVHVALDGHQPVEHRFRSDDRVNVYSVSKTFTAVALGLAESEGRLRLDDPFLDHLPELRPSAADGVDRITIRQLLTMTSGSSHVWFADDRIESGDLLRDFVTAEPAAAPGTAFRYTGSGPYVAGRVLARATGADLRSYLLPRIFDPLGIHNPAWHTCPSGYPFAESDLFLRTQELARFAALLLHDGDWHGTQLVPSGFADRMRSEVVDTGSLARNGSFTHGYGLGVWLCGDGDAYRMDGRYGQYVVIAPARGLAVTVTAHTERDQRLLETIWTTLVEPLG